MFAARGTCEVEEAPACAERVMRALDIWYDEAAKSR